MLREVICIQGLSKQSLYITSWINTLLIYTCIRKIISIWHHVRYIDFDDSLDSFVCDSCHLSKTENRMASSSEVRGCVIYHGSYNNWYMLRVIKSSIRFGEIEIPSCLQAIWKEYFHLVLSPHTAFFCIHFGRVIYIKRRLIFDGYCSDM